MRYTNHAILKNVFNNNNLIQNWNIKTDKNEWCLFYAYKVTLNTLPHSYITYCVINDIVKYKTCIISICEGLLNWKDYNMTPLKCMYTKYGRRTTIFSRYILTERAWSQRNASLALVLCLLVAIIRIVVNCMSQ